MTDQYHDMMVLQTWFSPAFPIGAFSYSHGLETAIQNGLVSNPDTLHNWITCLLEQGTGYNDGLFITSAYGYKNKANDLCLCLCASKERRQETSEMGQAFVNIVNASYNLNLPDGLAYPIAVGIAAQQMEVDLKLTLQCYLQAFAANLISVGVRSIPIGQQAGQKCLKTLGPIIKSMADTLSKGTLDDLGSGSFVSDIMAMQHEVSTPRIYRT